MKKKFILIGLGALVVLLALQYLLRPAVDVVRPMRGPAVQAVYATGTVEASVMLPIASRVAAKLQALHVDEGAEVKKGQILAQLDDADVKTLLEQARANERFAKQEYDRQIALNKQGYNSQSTFQKARSTWEAAKAASDKAEADLANLQLTAPDDGLIIKRDGEVGQLIPANQAVLWMSCCAPLRISVEVDEEDIAQVKPGQEVLIRADAFPNQVFKGKVQAITPKGDPVSRTYRVRVEFAEPVPLRIGMTAETNIIVLKNDDALLVPANLVSNGRLWLVRDGRLVEQQVSVGVKGLKQYEIMQGLEDGDEIIAAPVATLKAGKRVRTRTIEQK